MFVKKEIIKEILHNNINIFIIILVSKHKITQLIIVSIYL